ncbi:MULTISPECIES: cytochrome P450 [Streptomyces]|uniref:cytochrome P450 n=1 Tax=Streptomyces TaxID=1883 RepID=UPI001E295607|nr:cytochrome P450 [Streptomyces sp. CMSTAAHL-2]MCE3031876.1 cytochrome P450 [Streptomyces sp. CMSTAAHL-2]
MTRQYWLRWFSLHGVPRVVLRVQSRKGDTFARMMGPEGIADPHPYIETIRSQGRLVKTPLPWVTCDHALVRSVLRDDRFGVRSSARIQIPKVLQKFANRVPPPANPADPPAMLRMNPPDHTAMRKPVVSAFTPRAVKKLRDTVETVTEELLDAMPSGGSIELVESFASRVPIAIIFDILGMPREDQEKFLAWGKDMTPMLDVGISRRTYGRAMQAAQSLNDYLDRHIEKLRREPGDDILSNLVRSGDLDHYALKANASIIIGAGFETTANLIGHCVSLLLRLPEQLDRLRAEPQLWPNAVEEALRYEPPVFITARQALTDLELEGVQLPQGSMVMLSLAGANRDPAVFTDPQRFDVARPNANEHLSFSYGVHACFGASLARMEATHAVRALFERFPDMRAAAPPRLRRQLTFRGYAQVPVHLGRKVQVTPSTVA